MPKTHTPNPHPHHQCVRGLVRNGMDTFVEVGPGTRLSELVRSIEPTWSGLMFALAFVGLVCSLSYFFFSKEHRGVLGVTSRIGIYTLMIGFGVGFGLTVMGRVALLGHRVDVHAKVGPQDRVVRFVEMHLERDDAVLHRG